MLDAIANAAGNAADAVGDAANAVADAASGGLMAACAKVAESRIKELTGSDWDIEVETSGIPDSWQEWVRKTGMNSLCTEQTWRWCDRGNQWAKRKVDLWDERKISKIVMKVDENPGSDANWVVCWPEWETGSDTLTITWYPRAGRWESSAAWVDPTGSKRWWNIGDEIQFGLQLYQLPGKCFYKSDWLDDFEDVDPDGPFPFSTKKFKRWFQFRHWIIYWYPNSMWGWNWAYTKQPPELPDGSLFSLDAVLSVPSLPDFTMPQIKLPSLPDVEMPSLPDVSLPDVSLPDVSLPDAPSISAPSLSAPSLGSLPSMPDKKQRPEGRWACHGFVELTDLKCKADGSDLILSNAKVTHFWKDPNGGIETEEKENVRWVLKTTSNDQADSWVESLKESGVEEGDAGGCCTVA